jgi:hypothetical protein
VDKVLTTTSCAACGHDEADFWVEATGESLCHVCYVNLDVRAATRRAWCRALPIGLLVGFGIAWLLHWMLCP